MKLRFRLLGAVAGAALSMPALATTTYYSNNFESNANGISGAGSLQNSQGYSAYGFGSQYFRNDSVGGASQLAFNLSGAATNVMLNFDLALIDSWDGANGWGPDYFNVALNGPTLYTKNFNRFSSAATGSELTTLYYGPNVAVSSWGDQGYHVALSLGNLGAGAHTLAFFANGPVWQGGWDESFALDNLNVSGTSAVPLPGAIWLFGSALGLFGFKLRRSAEA